MLEWIWDYVKNRLGEGSTWAAICAIATSAGLVMNEVQTAAVIAAALAVYLVATLFFPNVFKTK